MFNKKEMSFKVAETKNKDPVVSSVKVLPRRGLAYTDQSQGIDLPPSSTFQLDSTTNLGKSLEIVSKLETKISELEREKVDLKKEATRLIEESNLSKQDIGKIQTSTSAEIQTKNTQIAELRLQLEKVKGKIKWPKSFKKMSEINSDAVDFLEKVIIEMENRYNREHFEAKSEQYPKIQDQIWFDLFRADDAPFNQYLIYDKMTESILDHILRATNSKNLFDKTNSRRKLIGLPESKYQEGKTDKPHTLALSTDVFKLYDPIYAMLFYLYTNVNLARLVVFMNHDEKTPIDLENQFPDVVEVWNKLEITPSV